MKFSELIGKKIICLSYAKELGIVFNCNVDRKLKKIGQLITVDREEDEGYIDYRKVCFGADTLFTTYSLADYTASGIAFPFRTAVYDTDGNCLGRVEDFEFDKNVITDLVMGEDEKIPSSNVVVASEDMIIVKGQRKIKPKTVEKKPLLNAKDAFNEYVLSDVNDRESQIVKTKPKVDDRNYSVIQPDTNEESPKKIISGYKFLLGRTVIKHIISGGKMLIPRGKVIDDETVELARKYGKLVELTVSSVKENENA